MPVDFEDLSLNCQYAIHLFNVLPDKVEGMNGIWLGKEWGGIGDIMEFYEIRDRKRVFELILVLVQVYGEHHREQRETRTRNTNSRGKGQGRG